MDASFRETLARGIAALRLTVDPPAVELLERYADRLVAWNRRVNLTAITGAAEIAEKHVVDSLALLPFLSGVTSLLDVGTGAGLPAIPLACARRDLDVVACDAVGKKIAFVKAVSAELGLRVRGVIGRAEGRPEREGLPVSSAVVSRALADPERWVPLGSRYVAPGGVLLAMIGRDARREPLEALGAAEGMVLEVMEEFTLPVSGAARAVARWRRGQ
jgi:16S rRNA (guanine527-N7)-methyltransferase